MIVMYRLLQRTSTALVPFFAIAICALATIASNARAELIQLDLVHPGDGKLTLDTDTGLSWLDVTVTQGLSVDYILGGGGGWLASGFRYAMISEVQTLATHAGVYEFNSGYLPLAENVPGVSLLIALLGNVRDVNPADWDASRGVAFNHLLDPSFENISFTNLHTTGTAVAFHQPFAGATHIPNIYVGHFLVTDRNIVSIEIKPDDEEGCFNLNGHGVIPVAILGSEYFSAYEIETSSLSLSGLAVRVRGNKGPLCSLEHVNDDDHLDLLCQFQDDPGAWAEGNDQATLSGQTMDGSVFMGTAAICVVP